MTASHDVLATDDAFFRALMSADRDALGGLLADDFVLVDVMQGAELGKESLLGVVCSKQLELDSIELWTGQRLETGRRPGNPDRRIALRGRG
jgi:hypothetical protein